MKRNKMKASILSHVKSIHLIDWILILYMTILMSQTIYNLFVHEINGNSNAIDGVIRTSSAGLFGYFMGRGFTHSNEKTLTTSQQPSNSDLDKGSISSVHYNNEMSEKRFHIQIIIISILGIISLITLILLRNLDLFSGEKSATASQLRDFVSGSTGFLTSQTKSNTHPPTNLTNTPPPTTPKDEP